MYTAAASKTRKLTFRQRVGLVESSALRELAARLRERRMELEREFTSRDAQNTGESHYDDGGYMWGSQIAYSVKARHYPATYSKKNSHMCFQ